MLGDLVETLANAQTVKEQEHAYMQLERVGVDRRTAKVMAAGVISDRKKKAIDKWHYVEKDGNPIREGDYIVTLVFDEFKNNERTGKKKACVEMRYFGDVDKDPSLKDWKMYDQPDHGLIWTEQCGSSWHEHVHAWIPLEEFPIAKLPEGVEEE